MDPWLESPEIWTGVHDSLIVYLAHDLNSRMGAGYVAVPGHRLVVEEPARSIYPDVFVTEKGPTRAAPAPAIALAEPVVVHIESEARRQTFIEIRQPRSGHPVVTVVEILSPSNKTSGQDARDQYLRKQEEVLASDIHLVEIDLLRGGLPTVALPAPRVPPADFRIVLRRANRRDRAEVYPIRLADRLPRFRIPLRDDDPDTWADLQELLERVYREGRYADLIDYGQPSEPPLSEADAGWARALLAESQPRGS